WPARDAVPAAQRVNEVAIPLIRRIRPRGMKPDVVTSALYCTPGMDRARPRAASRRPSLATSSADSQAIAGDDVDVAASAPRLTSTNSVFVRPGHSAVARTPVPRSSSCSASVKLVTYAFVAA